MSTSIASTLIVLSLAVGQSETSENITDLDWIIGDWRAELQARDAIAGVAPAGAQITHESSFRWILNGTRIQWDFQAKHDGTPFYTARAILGANEDGKLTHWWFDSAGDVDTARWSADKEGWKIRGQRNSWHVQWLPKEEAFIVTQTRVNGQELPVGRRILHARLSRESEVEPGHSSKEK